MQKSILIVGAGPVGLAAALFLHHYGHNPIIIQKRTSINPLSKALVINTRSLQLLDIINITPTLLQRSIKLNQLQIFYNNQRVVHNRFSQFFISQNKYDSVCILQQNQTQQIFQNFLNQRGIYVKRGCQLIALNHKNSKTQVTFKLNNIQTNQQFDSILGTDGAHSLCRKSSFIQFQGSSFDRNIYLQDVQLEGPMINGMRTFMTLQNTLGMIPIKSNNKMIRLISTLQNIQNILLQNYHIKNTFWKLNHRVAKKFNAGNIYLAGDAAHIHSPLGGRGMNLGIQDVYVFNKLLNENKLNQYSNNRVGVVKDVVSQVERLTGVFLSRGGLMRSMMGCWMPIMNYILRQKMTRFLFGQDHNI